MPKRIPHDRYEIRHRILHVLNYIYWKRKERGEDVRAHYGDVVRVYKTRYGLDVSPETITRTLRRLREEGVIWGEKGYFMPIQPFLRERALALFPHNFRENNALKVHTHEL